MSNCGLLTLTTEFEQLLLMTIVYKKLVTSGVLFYMIISRTNCTIKDVTPASSAKFGEADFSFTFGVISTAT